MTYVMRPYPLRVLMSQGLRVRRDSGAQGPSGPREETQGIAWILKDAGTMGGMGAPVPRVYPLYTM